MEKTRTINRTRAYLKRLIEAKDLSQWIKEARRFSLINRRLKPLSREENAIVMPYIRELNRKWKQIRDKESNFMLIFTFGRYGETICLMAILAKKPFTVSLWSYIICEYDNLANVQTTTNDEFLEEIVQNNYNILSKLFYNKND